METLSDNKIIGVEIGGTNIKVAIASSCQNMHEIIESITQNKIPMKDFKTHTDPEETITQISEWILNENKLNSSQIKRVCISNFGPLNVRKNSEDYGKILNTPKPGWKNFNVIQSFSNNLKISKENILIELDVNCAAFLEHKLGNHK
jgi:fructokinase